MTVIPYAIKILKMYIFERESMRWGGERRKGSQADCMLSTELDTRLDLMTLRS